MLEDLVSADGTVLERIRGVVCWRRCVIEGRL